MDIGNIIGAGAGLLSGNPELGALGVSGLIGSMGGSGGGGQDPQTAINAILKKALNNALQQNNQYSGQAVQTQNQYNQTAQNQFQAANQAAQGAATGAMNSGLQQYQQLQAPYARSGYDAMDAYRTSLGMNNIQGGSANFVSNQQQANQLAPQLQALIKGSGGIQGPGQFNQQAPDMKTYLNQVTNKNVSDYINQNSTHHDNSNGYSWTWNGDPAQAQQAFALYEGGPGAAGGQGYANQIRQNLANTQYQSALGQYNTQKSAYDTKTQQYGQLQQMLQGVSPEQMAQLAPLLRGKI